MELNNYPKTVQKNDLVYDWVKSCTFGAEGMPINVQIIGRPWHEEEILVAMKILNSALDYKVKRTSDNTKP